MGKVSPRIAGSMEVWWGKHIRVNGQVKEHISPYQQKVMLPLFKNIGQKTAARVTDNWLVAGLPILAGFLIKNWADSAYDRSCRDHWP